MYIISWEYVIEISWETNVWKSKNTHIYIYIYISNHVRWICLKTRHAPPINGLLNRKMMKTLQ